jgi:hypothetical protein
VRATDPADRLPGGGGAARGLIMLEPGGEKAAGWRR